MDALIQSTQFNFDGYLLNGIMETDCIMPALTHQVTEHKMTDLASDVKITKHVVDGFRPLPEEITGTYASIGMEEL